MWKSAALFAVLAVLGYQLYLVWLSKTSSKISFRHGAEYPTPPQPIQLDESELEAFRRDGFLLKRNVIRGDDLSDLLAAGRSLLARNTLMDWLLRTGLFAKVSTQIWREHRVFAQTAFESDLPALAAALMNDNSNNNVTKLRILKDGFFGFDGTGPGCGFHCDDKFFWPAADDTTGVNAWLTLSPVTSAGGGIRVVNQSLLDPATHSQCLDVIWGPTRGADFRNPTTCNMEQLSPSCFERLMAASVVFDMEPGDVLFWDRWTFHRSEPLAQQSSTMDESDVKLRYTIRYVPDTATARGATHPSVQQGAPLRGPYYPQVWPAAVKEEVDAIRSGIEADFQMGPKVVAGILFRRLKRMLAKP